MRAVYPSASQRDVLQMMAMAQKPRGPSQVSTRELDQKLADIAQAFAACDCDGSGSLDIAEFIEVMDNLAGECNGPCNVQQAPLPIALPVRPALQQRHACSRFWCTSRRTAVKQLGHIPQACVLADWQSLHGVDNALAAPATSRSESCLATAHLALCLATQHQ